MKTAQLIIKYFLMGLLILPAVNMFNPLNLYAEEAKLAPMDPDGTEWTIESTLIKKNGNKDSDSDKLVFENDQFFSEKFRKNGFEPTNYSVSLTENGMTKFGTMQNKDNDTAYWEGRIKEEAIGGTIYLYSKKGDKNTIKEEYYFKGTKSSGELSPKIEKKAVTTPAPAPVVPEIAEVLEGEVQAVKTPDKNSDISVEEAVNSDSLNGAEE